MKPDEAAALVRAILTDNIKRQFPFLIPTEAEAIRTVLEGFEAAIDDLDQVGTCSTCKRGPVRYKCTVQTKLGCYEWRGPEPGVEDTSHV